MKISYLPFLVLCISLVACRTETPVGSQSTIVDSATPWLTGFEKPAENPILRADSSYSFVDPITEKPVRWQRADVFNPGAVVKGDSVYLLFRAEDNPRAILGRRTSRIGLAASADGIHFERHPQPVLYPDRDNNRAFEEPGGCEDPRVVEMKDGRYLMLYTGWNQDVARLCSATSDDLRTWVKHGPVFQEAYGGKFHDTWSKSGSVVCKLDADGHLVATPINGKYWMYWGDAVVGLAHSDNLLDWTPVLNPDSTLYDPLPRRPGTFDSGLSEPGPPALLTDAGILVLYNGKNEMTDSLRYMGAGPGAYCGGQALFSASDPTQLLDRMEEPFICPSLPHEVSGQYASGTTFIEGLVYFKEKWFLYYGTADSMVGVAVRD
ncbi:glycoside hydrolase family 130 protein [Lewinella sp. JB7]|uniref:glycoside hydrolase family 130 protein n=1 Tax=Lewinella sp. JB7 TaxID=2962887 RepID=UPI0020C9A189|nr:glycoside hydrolase family 130 protein [Lewinella sp. JB7]MCP9234889.1 glycoside hydrolase family 130 protein [Lewinella sp. JB7]